MLNRIVPLPIPAALLCALAAQLATAPSSYVSVTIAELRAEPGKLHGARVAVTGTLTRDGNRTLLTTGDGALRVFGARQAPIGDVEVRGVAVDVGRLRREDPLAQRSPGLLESFGDKWPPSGEQLALIADSVTAASRQVAAVTTLPPLPLEIDFSVPVEGEADVRVDTRIRLQFSRDLDARSLDDRIRISYSAADSAERGEAQPPAVTFTVVYDPGARVVEITPAQPLERFREVTVDLLEGIVGSDGSVLRPWRLRFATGGS